MGQLQNLKDRIIATVVVKVGDWGGFEVRGLSPYDLTAMFMRHRGELSTMFDQFTAKAKAGESVDLGDGTALIAGALETAPLLVAEVIALATGSDPQHEDWAGDVAVAQKLSLGVQADALQKIAGLTFSEEMPAGKFVSLALDAMQNAVAGLQNQRSPAA